MLHEKIQKANVEDILGLSPMQEGILFHYLQNKESSYYFEQYGYELIGKIDITLFEKAWNYIGDINPMLRTVFVWEKVERPLQIVLKKQSIDIKFIDFSSMEDYLKEDAIGETKKEDKSKKFRLNIGSLFRVTLCKISENEHVMIISNHHILLDGWSTGIILKEFLDVYSDLVQHKTPKTYISTGFKEYLRWINSQDKQKLYLFWKDYLCGYSYKRTITPDFKLESDDNKTNNCTHKLSEDLDLKIEKISKEIDITPGAVYLTAWAMLLQLYSSTDDVVFGVTVSGRSPEIRGIENAVGLMINTIPFRANIQENDRFKEILIKTNENLYNIQEMCGISLAEIKSASEITNGTSIFDTILVLENYPLEGINEKSQSLKINFHSGSSITNYDLTVVITNYLGTELNFVYNTNVFEEETIELLKERYLVFLQTIVENIEITYGHAEFLTETEKDLNNYYDEIVFNY